MKIVDLFAGCGGLSIGFHKEGFHSLGFVEWDASSIKTLKRNFENPKPPFAEPKFLHTDIRAYEKYLDHGSEGDLSGICTRNGGIDGAVSYTHLTLPTILLV